MLSLANIATGSLKYIRTSLRDAAIDPHQTDVRRVAIIDVNQAWDMNKRHNQIHLLLMVLIANWHQWRS